MRSKIFSAGVLFLMLSVIVLVSLPDNTDAISFDPYEIPPGAPRWFELQDFDQKGDRLEITIVFKKLENGSFQERPISLLILESSMNHLFNNIDFARSNAIFIRENIETRLELSGENMVVNPRNSPMTILFYNEQQDGDLDNWEEATVKIRVDYQVFNAEKEESNVILILVLVMLIILIIFGSSGLGYYILKRRIRDNRTFFNPEGNLFYVFRDIDGSIFYFTEGQYAQMYSQNALVTYEYLGQAMKKGGPIMAPVMEQGMYGEGMGPVSTQTDVPVPLGSFQAPQPLQSATPQYDTYQEMSDVNPELSSREGNEGYQKNEGSWEDASERPATQEEEEGTDEPAGDGSDGVLDELVSGAVTVSEEPAEEEMIMRLGKDGDQEQSE